MIYAVDGENVVIVVDYGTRKLKNLRKNPRLMFVVDEFNPNEGVMAEGCYEIFERGKEYLRLLQVLYDRFEYYRVNPWDESESPILKISPSKCIVW